MILLSLVGDPGAWVGSQWGPRLLLISGFAVGLALLSLLSHRAPRIALTLAVPVICGYLAVGLPSIGMLPALMVLLFAAARARHQAFAGLLALGLFAVASTVRIAAGQYPYSVLGYELLANLALSGLAIAFAEFGILHRMLSRTQHKLQENQHKFADFASRANEHAETERLRAEERTRVSLKAQDELAHHLAVATLHGNAALEAVSDRHPANVSLEHVRDATSKALVALRRTIESLSDGESATRNAGSLGNIIELASSLRDAGLRVEVSAPGVDIDDDLPILLLRVVREAVTNAVIHADTSYLVIFLRPQPPQQGRNLWHVSVRNDGVRAGARDAAGGFGLANLKLKVIETGGSMDWGRLGQNFLLSAEIWQTQEPDHQG